MTHTPQPAWAVAKRSGGHIVGVFVDHGISGAKGRDKRAAFDRLLEAITARKIDMSPHGQSNASVAASGRLPRRAGGRRLRLVSAPTAPRHHNGREGAMFQMCGVFAEFERALIRERGNAGLARGAAEQPLR